MNTTPEDTLLNAIFTCDFGPGLDVASLIVNADDFVQSYNRKLWRAMLEVHARGEPLDCSCLVAQLMRGGQDERMSGDEAVNLLMRTMDGAPLKGYVEVYAKRVKEASRKHHIAKAVELANTRLTEGEDEHWVKQELNEQLLEAEADRSEYRDESVGEIAPRVLSALADRLNGDQSKLGLKTGLKELDDTTTGINPDELWILGAMPGRGKSALAIQVSEHLAGQGIGVYMISLEMSKAQVVKRLLRRRFGKQLENPGPVVWQEIADYAADLELLPMIINDEASLAVDDIVSHIRIAVRRFKPRLVIVDYLQLIRGDKRKERRENVGEAVNRLRQVAKDTHVPVLLLSQLRRPANLNDKPSMIDLKESGDIEAHAHVVLLLYMQVGDDGKFTGKEEIIIGKQREGPTGIVHVYFEGSRGCFHTRDTGEMK